jgi:hypothetical protein
MQRLSHASPLGLSAPMLISAGGARSELTNRLESGECGQPQRPVLDTADAQR